MAKKYWLSGGKVLVAMAAVLVTPAVLTLMTVAQQRPLVTDLTANPTHHGYTWSLSLFIVPVVVLAVWLSRRWESRIQNRAFWITTLVVSGSGMMLDMFFGLTFFNFPNHDAVLGIHFYGYSFVSGWQKSIPIEEIGFYVFGVMAVLLVYVWSDEFWFAAYNVDDTPRREARLRDVVSFHPASAILGGCGPRRLSRLFPVSDAGSTIAQHRVFPDCASFHQLACIQSELSLYIACKFVLGGGHRGAVSMVGF
jgi:hypothetical protein